jgi:syntaxin-binding protein 1
MILTKNNYISTGIKGELKSYLSDNIFNKIESLSKILILDNFTSQIIDSCFDKNELMTFNIFTKEQILEDRKPILVSSAIYFVTLTDENIKIILNEWKQENKYKSLNIFFPTKTSSQIIQKLMPIRKKIKSLYDLMICDFYTPETLIFDFKIKNDFLKFFGKILNQNIFASSVSQLSNIFFLLKSIPEIKYFCSDISSNFTKEFNKYIESKKQDFVDKSKISTLLILDRSYDIISPFLHEFTYQSILYEFYLSGYDFDKEGKYIYERTVVRDGKNIVEKFSLDENDPIWIKLRHKHILECLSEYNYLVENLDAKYPNIAKYQKDKKSLSLGDVGSAIKELAIYDSEKRLISAHGEILKKLLEIYDYDENNTIIKLKHIEDLEKKFISKENREKNKEKSKIIFQETENILKSNEISYSTKTRLIISFAITQGKGKVDDLIKISNLDLDIEAILKNISLIKKIKQENKLKDIIVNLVNKNLDQNLFPSINNEMQQSSLFSKQSRFGTKKYRLEYGNSNSNNDNSDFNLNFIELKTDKKIIIFIIGGITNYEKRIVDELTKELGIEIILGGSSLCNIDDLILHLSSLT